MRAEARASAVLEFVFHEKCSGNSRASIAPGDAEAFGVRLDGDGVAGDCGAAAVGVQQAEEPGRWSAAGGG